MKVRATKKYKELKLKDNQLKRIPEEGEEWEVTEERYKILTQTNKFNVVFVEKVEEAKEIETATKKENKEKVVKKQRKKKQ